mmetsp:Transcript_28428/g.90986  ORF Transcript_28428/g.90986 Transcript_28428/m.90986 type:complete len:251 (+) Transcript_28428:356-1108(+)
MAAFLLVMTMDHVLVDEERSPLREFVLRTGGEEQLILWHDKLARGKHLVDVLGLVWFIIGNLWVLSDDDSSPGQGKSALFILCVFFIVVYYIQICLPCAVAVAAIPVLCFCLPCLLRFMVRMQDAEAHAERRGAEEDVIDRIPIRKFASSQLSSDDDATCAICLCEYADEDQLRVLHCGHAFHKDCLDPWLRLNGSCPSCRAKVTGMPDTEMAPLTAASREEDYGSVPAERLAAGGVGGGGARQDGVDFV